MKSMPFSLAIEAQKEDIKSMDPEARRTVTVKGNAFLHEWRGVFFTAEQVSKGKLTDAKINELARYCHDGMKVSDYESTLFVKLPQDHIWAEWHMSGHKKDLKIEGWIDIHPQYEIEQRIAAGFLSHSKEDFIQQSKKDVEYAERVFKEGRDSNLNIVKAQRLAMYKSFLSMMNEGMGSNIITMPDKQKSMSEGQKDAIEQRQEQKQRH